MAVALTAAFAVPVDAATPKRVKVSGEIIDTWCYVTEIMFALGTAHHQCAVWCAVGGVPVSILGEDGNVYVVLKVEDDSDNVANPKIVDIQTHKVTVDGDLYERDGVRYLIVTQVLADGGIVNIASRPRRPDVGRWPRDRRARGSWVEVPRRGAGRTPCS